MNVLITSAGRRTSLLQTFAKATQTLGGKVLAGDRDGLAPSLYLADKAFKLPLVNADDYVSFLLSLVRKHHIRLIVPTIDTELLVLAQNKALFGEAECTALISTTEFVEITTDKWLTCTAFAAQEIDTPKSWLPNNLEDDLPQKLFVKPRDGSASRDAQKVDRDKLDDVLTRVANAIIQEELVGPEITIDALIDLNGRPIHYVPRLRIKTLAGESIQGVTLPDRELRNWLTKTLEVASHLGARGPITLQAFLTDRGPVLSEINSRFGGGFPLTYAAGGKYPDWILGMIRGEHLSNRIGDYQSSLYMTRYHVEHFISEPLWQP
jgi:carbamoyl-phosphate synthase large subunit